MDDCALRRGRRYATLVIDAVSHRRVDVLPDRRAATVAARRREHPGVRVVCRDGSTSYAGYDSTARVRPPSGLVARHRHALCPGAEPAEALRRPATRWSTPNATICAAEPAVAVTRLLAEIREQGYPGSATLLVRSLTQRRADPHAPRLSPRRLVSWLASRPADLRRHLG
ncbi:transposase [Frankia sp. CiP3]|uniref:transposase n=1 Tax=Frankia sp. CiP3 TaxID=2880971 RepID=UPI001EF7260A|nr:transposase [Frankia sp. CiP3]